jgi:tripartite-type tricarboxylate transporter receptor subunit TctC
LQAHALARCLIGASVLLVATVPPKPAAGQEYPSKPIRCIVPYAPGGSSDFLARVIGQKLAEAWGQQIVVDNRAGAAGNIGTDAAAKAPPDGYTLLLVASTITMNPSLYAKLPFDAEKDLAPVTQILWQPWLLSIHPSLPVTNLKQLLALAKAKPGELNYASGGAGTSGHIAAELFASMAGVKLTHVPYRSLGPAGTALLTGEVQLVFQSPIAGLEHVRSGKIRGIGVSGRKRMAALPQVPTLAEGGLPGYDEGNWQGVFVPAQTPRAIVTKLNQELVRTLRTFEVTDQVRRVGGEVIASAPEEFSAVVRDDLKKYAALIKAVGIRAD